MNFTRPESLKSCRTGIFLGNFEIAEGAEKGGVSDLSVTLAL